MFFDSEENRYIGSVAYQLKPIWTKEQIQAYCEAADGTNEHFVLYKGAAFERKQQLEDEDFPVVLSAIKRVEHWMKTMNSSYLKKCWIITGNMRCLKN